MLAFLPWKNDALLICKTSMQVEGAETYRWREFEGLGTKIEFTLLKGHEAGCCKETTPTQKKKQMNNKIINIQCLVLLFYTTN